MTGYIASKNAICLCIKPQTIFSGLEEIFEVESKLLIKIASI
jgi:hypothetical protein